MVPPGASVLALHGAGGVAGGCSLLTISRGRKVGRGVEWLRCVGGSVWVFEPRSHLMQPWRSLTALRMRVVAAKEGMHPLQGIQSQRGSRYFEGR